MHRAKRTSCLGKRSLLRELVNDIPVDDRVAQPVADLDSDLLRGSSLQFKYEAGVDIGRDGFCRKRLALRDGEHRAVAADEKKVERHRRVFHPEGAPGAARKDEKHSVIVAHRSAEHQAALAFFGVVSYL